MTKYRSLATETRWVDDGRRLVKVEPGDIVDIPDDPARYVQTGEHGEVPLFELVQSKAAKPQKESA